MPKSKPRVVTGFEKTLLELLEKVSPGRIVLSTTRPVFEGSEPGFELQLETRSGSISYLDRDLEDSVHCALHDLNSGEEDPIRDHAIHNDTPISKRVDFHSFRRAFATSLAEAGVNEQRAMMLTSHSDSKVHARYVQETLAMQAIPEGAVPPIPVFDTTGKGTAVPKRSKRPDDPPKKLLQSSMVGWRARLDSNQRPTASETVTLSS